MGTKTIQEENDNLSNNHFYVGLGIYMIVLAFVGFWNTYFGSLFKGTFDAHWLIHVHMIVFATWLVLYLSRTALALKNKIKHHKNFGTYFGIPWGILLLILGFIVTFGVITSGIGEEHQIDQYTVPLLASLGDLFAFPVLFIAAVYYRKRPPFHKRFIVLATASLMEVPVARIARQFEGPTVLLILFIIPLFL